MSKVMGYWPWLGLAVWLLAWPPAGELKHGQARAEAGAQRAVLAPAAAPATSPLAFEQNQGQTDQRVKFLARGSGYSVFLTAREAVLVLGGGEKPSVLRLRPLGANRVTRISGLEELPGKSNYLAGKDPAKWHSNIANYARVLYQDVYPGIDLAYHGSQGHLEYDWIVQPGADPAAIRMSFSGARRLRMDNGELVVETAAGELRNRRPVVYQESGGTRRYVAASYALEGGRQVRFRLGAYDARAPLIIDPTLLYTALLGGTKWPPGWPRYTGYPFGPAIDPAGNVYLVVGNYATDFLLTGSIGTPRGSAEGCCYYAVKLNASGAMVYSTQLGFLAGAGGGNVSGMAVDSSGSMYITGSSGSALPATAGAFQTSPRHDSDAFVAKLNPTGSALVYATFLGGSIWGGVARARSRIAVDAAGNAYVAGWTNSSDFLTTPGAMHTCGSSGGLFVTKINTLGTAVGYSACLGGTLGIAPMAPAIAIDSTGNVYVAGSTTSTSFPTTPGSFQPISPGGASGGYPHVHGFVFKLNATGSAFIYSTFLAGSGGDNARAIAVDPSGNTYVTGVTDSADFPTTPGVLHTSGSGIFIAKLNPAGSALVYSTYVGGTGSGDGIALDAAGNAYVVGTTLSEDFPLINPIQTRFANGERRECLVGSGYQVCEDALILKLNATGTALLYSTYFGGGGDDQAFGVTADNSGNAYVTGTWGSGQPSLRGTGEIGVFVLKLADAGSSAMLTSEGVTNGATFQFGISPGGIATVFGSNITNVNGILSASSLPLPTELGGSSVTVNGVRAPTFAVANVNGQQQINFQVPPNTSFYFPFSVAVINNGAHSVPVSVNQSPARPGIFTTDGTRGAILHGSDFQPVTASHPAAKGEAVVIYATGLGPVQPEPGAGHPASSSPLSRTVYATSVTVGGVPAQVLFSGLAPGFIGLNQVNIQIPPEAPSGDVDVLITTTSPSNLQDRSNRVKLAVR